ncbi:MAG TPA: peptidylprolyl isomerase [Solirubrobacteraceae bacterium]|nr:peptidylprolyl isomerase [Solirubrobacteraceae bacterium]
MPRPFRLVSLLAAGALGLGACGGEEDPTTATSAGAPQRPESAQPRPQAPAQSGARGCQDVEAPPPKGGVSLPEPTLQLERDTVYTAVMDTSCGPIEIRLANRESPETAASFVSLARRGFYDGLTFHRIGKDATGGDFVIQGGDPLGSGQGDPGYSVVEPPPEGVVYDRGTVAMAKTEIEEPGTSGSQFFIVTADNAKLPPDYALLGEVVEGRQTVADIASVEVDQTTEAPKQPVVISDIEIEESEGE